MSHSNLVTVCSEKFMLAIPLSLPDRTRDAPYLNTLVLPTYQLKKIKAIRFQCDAGFAFRQRVSLFARSISEENWLLAAIP